jgi:hypothetical protein
MTYIHITDLKIYKRKIDANIINERIKMSRIKSKHMIFLICRDTLLSFNILKQSDNSIFLSFINNFILNTRIITDNTKHIHKQMDLLKLI